MFPIVDSVIGLFTKAADKIFPDATKKLEVQATLDQLKNAIDEKELALISDQIKLNMVDAASADKFQARARPFIMWVCGFAFAVQYVLGPLVHPFYVIPALDMSVMMPVLLGMLGLGSMRSFDKLQANK